MEYSTNQDLIKEIYKTAKIRNVEAEIIEEKLDKIFSTYKLDQGIFCATEIDILVWDKISKKDEQIRKLYCQAIINLTTSGGNASFFYR